MRLLLFSTKSKKCQEQTLEEKKTQNLRNLRLLLPEGEEVVLEVGDVDKMSLVDRQVLTIAQMVAVAIGEISMVEISPGTTAVMMVGHLATKAKVMATLVETKEIEGEVEEGLTPAQMSEGLE